MKRRSQSACSNRPRPAAARSAPCQPRPGLRCGQVATVSTHRRLPCSVHPLPFFLLACEGAKSQEQVSQLVRLAGRAPHLPPAHCCGRRKSAAAHSQTPPASPSCQLHETPGEPPPSSCCAIGRGLLQPPAVGCSSRHASALHRRRQPAPPPGPTSISGMPSDRNACLTGSSTISARHSPGGRVMSGCVVEGARCAGATAEPPLAAQLASTHERRSCTAP